MKGKQDIKRMVRGIRGLADDLSDALEGLESEMRQPKRYHTVSVRWNLWIREDLREIIIKRAQEKGIAPSKLVQEILSSAVGN